MTRAATGEPEGPEGEPGRKSSCATLHAQLNNQESRLEALEKESEQLDAKVESAQGELDRMIQALSFDVKL